MLLPDQTYEQAVGHPNKILPPKIPHLKVFHRKGDSKFLKIDREYLDDVLEEEIDQDEVCSNRNESTGSYEKTSEFFNNIPDYVGETFMPFDVKEERGIIDDRDNVGDDQDDDEEKKSFANSSDILRECEQFLWRYRIRSDFFCKYHKAVR